MDDACGVWVVDVSEAELVHDGDGPCTHGDDVADDPADSCCCALVGLNVGGVVVGFDFEGHCPAVADVDDACVFADSDEEVFRHLGGGFVTEGAQVDFGGFVGAVLGPHDGVHGEFGCCGAAAEDVADALVFVVFESEGCVRLFLVRGVRCVVDGVRGGRAGGSHSFPHEWCARRVGASARRFDSSRCGVVEGGGVSTPCRQPFNVVSGT